jgi:hypothetical protein
LNLFSIHIIDLEKDMTSKEYTVVERTQYYELRQYPNKLEIARLQKSKEVFGPRDSNNVPAIQRAPIPDIRIAPNGYLTAVPVKFPSKEAEISILRMVTAVMKFFTDIISTQFNI